MAKPVLADAFAHHVWATLRVMDACEALRPEQLGTSVPGTYGSILDTLRHIVGGDAWYLFAVAGRRDLIIDEETTDLPELRASMGSHGDAWAQVVSGPLDPDTTVVRRRDDGSQTHAPLGIRLAQALHHGSDHRSQICTVLTTLGVEPPAIDAWDFGLLDGRVVEVPAPS